MPKPEETKAAVMVLMIMTGVTGLVDAVSILALGHVFTANMTGNTVFLGFSLGGAHGFSIPNSITALLGFFIGAAFGGRLATVGNAAHAFATEALLLFCAAIAAVQFSPLPQSGVALDGVIAVTALAMGLQNATARKLGVPDLTTTVLTLTITGLAADSRIAGGVNPRWQRRCAAVLAMIGGAVVGALLVSQSVALPLFACAATTAVCAFAWHVINSGKGNS